MLYLRWLGCSWRSASACSRTHCDVASCAERHIEQSADLTITEVWRASSVSSLTTHISYRRLLSHLEASWQQKADTSGAL